MGGHAPLLAPCTHTPPTPPCKLRDAHTTHAAVHATAHSLTPISPPGILPDPMHMLLFPGPTVTCARPRAGCSQSRQRFESARLFDSKPDQLPLVPGSTRIGTANKYTLPKAAYRNRTGLELKKADGTVVYKVNKVDVWADKHVLTDAKGNKVALLRREQVEGAIDDEGSAADGGDVGQDDDVVLRARCAARES